jgi:hypothetical protein
VKQLLAPTRLRSGKIIQPEISSDNEEEPLNLSVPELPGVHPPTQLHEPLHIDPSTIDGFIPEHTRVSGNHSLQIIFAPHESRWNLGANLWKSVGKIRKC